MLTKSKIEQSFKALNDELAQQHLFGDILIVGGSYMVLVFDSRPATKDVDAVFKPAAELRKAALKVADNLQLPEDWLNDGVKGFLPSKQEKIQLLSFSNLKIWVPQPEYILAMKCVAARPDTSDRNDIVTLIQHLKLKKAEQVFEIISNYYPKRAIPPKTQYFIEELFEKETLGFLTRLAHRLRRRF